MFPPLFTETMKARERMKKCKWVKIGCLVLLSAVFIGFVIYFNTTLHFPKPGDAEIGITYAKARVVSIDQEDIGPDPDFNYIRIGKQWLTLEILSGDQKGHTTTAINYIERVNNRPAVVGTNMIISSYDGFITTMIVNYNREASIYMIAALFFAAVLLIGRKKGLKSIAGLLFTLMGVFFLFIPMILRGVEPIIAAIIVVILSAVVSLTVLNGLCKKTLIAAVSCIICTLLAGGIGYLTGQISHISTLNTGEAELLLFISNDTALEIKNLLFAGILIAALGAVMDTSMSLASSLVEMKEINPSLTRSQLFRSGMNIGKDVMGTMTNTLILAFTGSSINTLLVYFMYGLPYIGFINLDLIVIEIVKGLSGSLAVVLSIPITTLLGSRILTADRKSGFIKIFK